MERGAGTVVETIVLLHPVFIHHFTELLFTFLNLFNVGIECMIFLLLLFRSQA